jgi:hypothetical protein
LPAHGFTGQALFGEMQTGELLGEMQERGLLGTQVNVFGAQEPKLSSPQPATVLLAGQPLLGASSLPPFTNAVVSLGKFSMI